MSSQKAAQNKQKEKKSNPLNPFKQLKGDIDRRKFQFNSAYGKHMMAEAVRQREKREQNLQSMSKGVLSGKTAESRGSPMLNSQEYSFSKEGATRPQESAHKAQP